MKDNDQFIRGLKRKHKLNKPEMRGLVSTFHKNLRDFKTIKEAEKETEKSLNKYLEKREIKKKIKLKIPHKK